MRRGCVLFHTPVGGACVMRPRRRQPPSRYSPPARRPLKRQRTATAQLDEQRRVSRHGKPKVPSSGAADSSTDGGRAALSVSFNATQVEQLRQRLLDWYVDNHRRLPWRAPPRHSKHAREALPAPQVKTQACAGAPYAVWISEMMSQQTRISVVIEYYERWMKRFPTVHDLADASLEQVYQLWAGLGYYRRARFVHEAAKQIVCLHDGVIPQHVAELEKLSGIGMYTAGAISSIAYGHAVPLVDGNVRRVLSRLRTAITTGLTSQNKVSREYWRLASTCVEDIENAADFNQALMELGATVCKPKGARCEACPISSMCEAFKEATAAGVNASEYVTRYPVKDKRKATKVRNETVVALVVCDVNRQNKRVLMRVRQGDGLLGGLLETPNVVVARDGDDEVQSAVASLLKEVCDGQQVGARDGECDALVDGGRIKHVFSHILQSIVIKVLLVRSCTRRWGSEVKGARWVEETELANGAVSTQMKKVVGAALSKL